MTDLPAGSLVIGYDTSAHSQRALDWGLDQAARERRPVDVIHALDVASVPSAAWVGAPGGALPLLEALRRADRAELDEVVERARQDHPGLEVRGHVTDAEPRAGLVKLSERAHLLVLGSHGRGPLLSSLLGSVSAAVVRDTSCPTVVVRHPRGDSAPTEGSGILVGVDGTAESRPVVEFAFAQAALRRLPLTVVHCVHDLMSAYVGGAANPPLAGLQEGRAMLSETVAGMAEKHPDVEVTRRLEGGLLEHLVDRRDQPWDLAVVGGRRHGPWQRLLVGAITTAVLEHATCPVAVVPEAHTAHPTAP